MTGVVKVVAEESNNSHSKTGSNSVYMLYLAAINVLQQNSRKQDSATKDDVNMTSRDVADPRLIQEIQNMGPNIFKFLVNSLCPTIFGLNVVKAAFLLGLFGGSKVNSTGEDVPTRSDPHILVVGDPGMGKSQILSAVAAVAPRNRFL